MFIKVNEKYRIKFFTLKLRFQENRVWIYLFIDGIGLELVCYKQSDSGYIYIYIYIFRLTCTPEITFKLLGIYINILSIYDEKNIHDSIKTKWRQKFLPSLKISKSLNTHKKLIRYFASLKIIQFLY